MSLLLNLFEEVENLGQRLLGGKSNSKVEVLGARTLTAEYTIRGLKYVQPKPVAPPPPPAPPVRLPSRLTITEAILSDTEFMPGQEVTLTVKGETDVAVTGDDFERAGIHYIRLKLSATLRAGGRSAPCTLRTSTAFAFGLIIGSKVTRGTEVVWEGSASGWGKTVYAGAYVTIPDLHLEGGRSYPAEMVVKFVLELIK